MRSRFHRIHGHDTITCFRQRPTLEGAKMPRNAFAERVGEAAFATPRTERHATHVPRPVHIPAAGQPPPPDAFREKLCKARSRKAGLAPTWRRVPVVIRRAVTPTDPGVEVTGDRQLAAARCQRVGEPTGVLIVDDDAERGETLEDMFTGGGHACELAADAIAAGDRKSSTSRASAWGLPQAVRGAKSLRPWKPRNRRRSWPAGASDSARPAPRR